MASTREFCKAFEDIRNTQKNTSTRTTTFSLFTCTQCYTLVTREIEISHVK